MPAAIHCFAHSLCVHTPPHSKINVKIGLKSEQRKTQNFLGGIVLQPRLNGILAGRNEMKQVRDKQKITKRTGKESTIRESQQTQQRRFMPQEFEVQDEKWKR